MEEYRLERSVCTSFRLSLHFDLLTLVVIVAISVV